MRRYLNLERWKEALLAASPVSDQRPENDLVAAFVAFELGEHEAAMKEWRESRGSDRTAFERMAEMRTPRFARERAAELRQLLGN